MHYVEHQSPHPTPCSGGGKEHEGKEVLSQFFPMDEASCKTPRQGQTCLRFGGTRSVLEGQREGEEKQGGRERGKESLGRAKVSGTATAGWFS